MTNHEIVVTSDLDGERSDRIVANLLEISRTSSRAIIDAGGATLAGVPLRPGQRLVQGDVVAVEVIETDSTIYPDDTVPFEVAYADDALLVIDKPIGLVVHPGSGRSDSTLVHGLLSRYPEIDGVGQDGRWGIVHRLDRDTSGLLVVARTERAYADLTRMMREREVSRRYLSLVAGSFSNATGTIEAPIGRDRYNRTRMRVDRDGRDARTHYRRLAGWDSADVSLLSVTLDTGRTHQIRVHLGAIGHPVIGDSAYGKRGSVGDPNRPWLHAREIRFTHPQTGEVVDIVSRLPSDLSDSLTALADPDTGTALDVDGAAL